MDKESSSMYKFQPVCHPGRGSYSGDHDFHHHPFDGPTGPTGASPDWLGRDRRLLHLHHSGAYPPGQWQGQSEPGGIPHCCHPHIRGIFCLRTGINTMDGCRYIHITQLQMHKGYLFCLSQLTRCLWPSLRHLRVPTTHPLEKYIHTDLGGGNMKGLSGR